MKIHTERDRDIESREKGGKRQYHKDGRVEIGTFRGADTGRLSNKANSTVGVRNSHATLCDPVSLPELLYWKHCGAASTEEAVGFLEPQG